MFSDLFCVPHVMTHVKNLFMFLCALLNTTKVQRSSFLFCLCTFPGRAVQWISPWMYVTMMMTDQIPLDLAPPPLLNGEVPLMPHMVNGDAAQQVRTTLGCMCTSVICMKLSPQMLLSTLTCNRTHARINQMHARMHIKQPCRPFPLLSFHHTASGLPPGVITSCF